MLIQSCVIIAGFIYVLFGYIVSVIKAPSFVNIISNRKQCANYDAGGAVCLTCYEIFDGGQHLN